MRQRRAAALAQQPAPAEVKVVPQRPIEDVLADATATRPIHRPSTREAEERREKVAQLMALGVTREQLPDAFRQLGLVATEGQLERDYRDVRRRWHAELEEERSTDRSAQLQRLKQDLPRLRRDKKWKEVLATEQLIARISGHFAPLRVHVDAAVAVRESLVAVVAGMSPDELDALAVEQAEVEALAEEGRVARALPPARHGEDAR